MTLTLPSACTIAEVEAASDKLRGIPEEVASLEIDASNVEEMDTAFFQLLLALKATMDVRRGVFALKAVSPEVCGLCELYGVQLEKNRTKDEE